MKCFVALFFLLAFFGCGVCQAAEDATPKGDVLATVGNREITRQMLQHIIDTIPPEARVQFLTPDGRRKILEEVFSIMLFAEAARKNGIDKDPAVQTRLGHIQQEYLATEYFRRRLAEKPLVTEDELKKYYESHIQEFKPPEEIKARHILVRTEAEARKVLDRLKSVEDFAELAKQVSIDPAAAKGGLLELQEGVEWLPRGTFEKSFDVELWKIPTDQVGGPIKTQFGWHVIKVEGRRRPSTPQFEQVRSMIKNRIEEERREALKKQIAEELRKIIPARVN